MQTGKAVEPVAFQLRHLSMVDIGWVSFFVVFLNMCLNYCYLPSAFTSSVIVPIIKNKAGQLSDINNYRAIAIAIANACSKLLESVMYKYILLMVT